MKRYCYSLLVLISGYESARDCIANVFSVKWMMNERNTRQVASTGESSTQGTMIRSLFTQQPDILNGNFHSAKPVCIPIFFIHQQQMAMDGGIDLKMF